MRVLSNGSSVRGAMLVAAWLVVSPAWADQPEGEAGRDGRAPAEVDPEALRTGPSSG
jgi:hypothetical protein